MSNPRDFKTLDILSKHGAMRTVVEVDILFLQAAYCGDLNSYSYYQVCCVGSPRLFCRKNGSQDQGWVGKVLFGSEGKRQSRSGLCGIRVVNKEQRHRARQNPDNLDCSSRSVLVYLHTQCQFPMDQLVAPKLIWMKFILPILGAETIASRDETFWTGRSSMNRVHASIPSEKV